MRHAVPSPQLVRYNDWRQVAAPAPKAFVPELPVSVIIPYCARPEERARTLAAHARWHHAVPDAVTLGLWGRLQVDGVDPGAIRSRPGTVKELFDGRKVDDSPWFQSHLLRTGNLTSKADHLFLVVLSGNLGVHREFCELVGRLDESFTQWGG